MKPRLRAVPQPASKLSVGAAAALARRSSEIAAMLEEVSNRVFNLFDSKSRTAELLLQREGEGPRPATIDALHGLLMELYALTDKYKKRSLDLLAASIPCPDGMETTKEPEPEAGGLDHVVENPDVARKQMRTGTRPTGAPPNEKENAGASGSSRHVVDNLACPGAPSDGTS